MYILICDFSEQRLHVLGYSSLTSRPNICNYMYINYYISILAANSANIQLSPYVWSRNKGLILWAVVIVLYAVNDMRTIYFKLKQILKE